ncbi:MAG TPA: homoserine dehydrogenase [Candidatus Angelobacter sp.]|jgi:homoserine dehydrogenase|nr:homoserine dehydrogenase [Candidatus Angelobacter sp.]
MASVDSVSAAGSSGGQVRKEVRVGIVGYGTVGRAAAEILTGHAQEIRERTGGVSVVVTRICRKSPKGAESGVNGVRVTADWHDVVGAEDVDVVIEAVGGITIANEIVRDALDQGKPVVTANKALLARRGEEIFALAKKKNLPVGIEASVAGGVPVIRAISQALAADRIVSVYGIVNGTCNFILTQMEQKGLEFAEALEQAQAAGYAEADSSLDIDGFDARDKIAILARIAFGHSVDPALIPVTGIRQITATDFHYAHRLNSTIRLVASAERTSRGIHLAVQPWLEPRNSMLAKVDGANNAIFIAGERVGTQMLYGRGAGGNPTGTAVLSDVIEIAQQLARGQMAAGSMPGFHKPEPAQLSPRLQPMNWFLRLAVNDRPGILARVAEVIAHEGINIDSVIQEPHMPKDRLSFVITLEPTLEETALRAVNEINKFEFLRQPVLLLPMISEIEEHV